MEISNASSNGHWQSSSAQGPFAWHVATRDYAYARTVQRRAFGVTSAANEMLFTAKQSSCRQLTSRIRKGTVLLLACWAHLHRVYS